MSGRRRRETGGGRRETGGGRRKAEGGDKWKEGGNQISLKSVASVCNNPRGLDVFIVESEVQMMPEPIFSCFGATR